MHKYLFIVLLFLVSNCFAQDDDSIDPTKPTLPGSVDENYGDSTSSHGVYLNGIVVRSGDYAVILNSKVLHTGNDIEGYTIASITRDSVILKPKDSNNSKDFIELKLSNLNFKQPHK